MPEHVVVAEWLRRQTRNLLGFSRAGSNPTAYDLRTENGGGSWFQNNYFQKFNKKILWLRYLITTTSKELCRVLHFDLGGMISIVKNE